MGMCVSLFRGINVGGNHQVKMKVLKELHEALGLSKVTNYIQSGNIVFESDNPNPADLAAQIQKEFDQKFGFHSEVIIRTSAELKELPDRNPFITSAEKETKSILVMFLTASPDIQVCQELLNAHSGPEEFFIMDKELFVYYPNGMGRSKLSNVFIEKKLKVLGTGRNWNTVTKLLEMTQL